jgi:putative addiction module component (TIGR02574 family)
MSVHETLRREIAKLPIEQRMRLIEEVWDDIEAEIDPELTPEQEALLEERYLEHLRNPDAPRKTLKEIAARLGASL